MTLPAIADEQQLDGVLSTPGPADIALMQRLPGDILILGAGGKMGPTLARLAKRAADAAAPRRIAVASRFSAPGVRRKLESWGVETIRADLLDRAAVNALRDAPNVIFMAGRKFGTGADRALTWAVNTLAPALAAEKFRASRMVVFSTGNVYPLTAVDGSGPDEQSPVGPVGEYAQSALGRERTFEYFSRRNGSLTAVARLNYAVELRYGVLRDIGDKVFHGRPVDLTMGWVNVIWQRDANSAALRLLESCASPPFVLNVTGAETLSVRSLAQRFAERFGVAARFRGTESRTALLSNAARFAATFGRPETGIEAMIERTADWIRLGGASLGKPTHFEQRAGEF